MNVRISPDSEITVYDLALLPEVNFVADDQHCLLSTRDVMSVDPMNWDLYLGNGFVERKGDNIVLSWREISPSAFPDLDRVTFEIQEAVRNFFQGIHISETVRPERLDEKPQSVRELLQGMPPYNAEKMIFDSSQISSSPSFSAIRLADTIPPSAPILSDIEGVLITPDGEVVLSELLEVAMQSFLTSDPELSALVESGAVRQARMQAICRPLFMNALRKMKQVTYQPFDSLKRKLRER